MKKFKFFILLSLLQNSFVFASSDTSLPVNYHSSVVEENSIVSTSQSFVLPSRQSTQVSHDTEIDLEEGYSSDEDVLGRGEVALYWYPRTAGIIHTATALMVDGKIWKYTSVATVMRQNGQEASLYSYEVMATAEEAEFKAQVSRRGQGFFKFTFDVPSEELENLQEYLESRPLSFVARTCVSASCDALTKSTRIKIPALFGKTLPILNAGYLAFSYHTNLGSAKVKKIEYIGQSAIRNLVSPGILCEACSPYLVFKAMQWSQWICASMTNMAFTCISSLFE